MIQEIYFRELSEALRYLAAWMPNSRLELGDIVNRITLERRGNIRTLQEIRVDFTRRHASTLASFEYSSAAGASITTKVAGRVVVGSSLAKADAGLVVKFSKENAIVFEATGCTGTAIDDIDGLGKSIVTLSAAGKWDPNWLVVTEVVRANCATIIVSTSRDAQIDLKVSGKITPGALRLADPSARLVAENYRDIGFKFIAESGLTPLYRANGIKRGLLGGRSLSSAYRVRSPTAAPGRVAEALPNQEFVEFLPGDFFRSN
jgi:hypothetical protein